MKNPGFLTLRLPPIVGAALDAAARASGVSVSGYARSAIVAVLPDVATLPPLPPSPSPPPRRPVIIPDADVAAIARFGSHLGRLTGAIVQLSKACRETDRIREHESLESEIRDLRVAKVEVVALVQRLRAAEASTK